MSCSSCNSAQQIWPYGADMVVPEPAHFDEGESATAPAVEAEPTAEPEPAPVAEPESDTDN